MSSIPFKYIKPQALLILSPHPEKITFPEEGFLRQLVCLSEGPITDSKSLRNFYWKFQSSVSKVFWFGLIMENDAQSLFNKSLITVENPLETSPRSLSIVRTKNQVPPSLDY